MRKLTTENFITRAKEMHGDKYDYSKSIYKGFNIRISIICKVHGLFEQLPGNHLKGFGCKRCAKQHTPTNEEFIEQAKNIHGDKYDYSNVDYKNAKTKVEIICPVHGPFEQTPDSHLSGRGCISCGGSKKLTTEIFKDRGYKIHNGIYDYANSIYAGLYIPVVIGCKIHGKFNQKPCEHLSGNGCPSCAGYGFQPSKPAYLYYLKITTEDDKILYKIGITNRTVDERFQIADLQKIEIVKQKLYENGQDALDWETKLKRKYKEYQYQGPDILSSGNTELFTEDIIAMWYNVTNESSWDRCTSYVILLE